MFILGIQEKNLVKDITGDGSSNSEHVPDSSNLRIYYISSRLKKRPEGYSRNAAEWIGDYYYLVIIYILNNGFLVATTANVGNFIIQYGGLATHVVVYIGLPVHMYASTFVHLDDVVHPGDQWLICIHGCWHEVIPWHSAATRRGLQHKSHRACANRHKVFQCLASLTNISEFWASSSYIIWQLIGISFDN